METRWECSGCKAFVFVLDRRLPDKCHRCGRVCWRQTPFKGTAKLAPMERDMLLARGEEQKFLNGALGKVTLAKQGVTNNSFLGDGEGHSSISFRQTKNDAD